MSLQTLIDDNTRIRVSSTLDKSVGKKGLTDGSPETCWTSSQGLPQYIHITFTAAVLPQSISITFQGGFVGTRCKVDVLPLPLSQELIGATPTEFQTLTHLYPDDVNRRQKFELPKSAPVQQIKLIFEESSDFFGRVTIYDLYIEGLFT